MEAITKLKGTVIIEAVLRDKDGNIKDRTLEEVVIDDNNS